MFEHPLLLAAAILALSASAPAQEVSIERVDGPPRFVIESGTVTDLSGIVWIDGDSFFAVADHPNVIIPLTLKIDRANGNITHGEIGTPVAVKAPVRDFEGVTYLRKTKTFYVSAEDGSAVVSFALGSTATALPVPKIFARARKNLSLESITWNETVGQFWIANEEALATDGPVSGATGTVVRLQKLDAQFRPLAQYAWRTEPAAFRFRDSGNGVSDLCLLPDGQLIVLERGFAGGGLHLRLYLADFEGATDVSKLAALENADFQTVRKKLLFEEPTGFVNFEGLTLGPALEDGTRSLVIIADSNGGRSHTFLALKLRLSVPIPKTR